MMPLAYIYDNEADALALVAAIDAILGLPREGCVCTTYDVPAEHPTDGRWSVLADAGEITTEQYRLNDQLPEGTPVPAELTEDWFELPS